MRMRRLNRPVAVLCVAALLGQGCGWIKEHNKIVTGAAIGAVGGAALGYMVGGRRHHRGRAVVGGALLGALAGGLVGAYLEHQEKTAAQTNQAYNYNPNQGVRLDLTNVATDPATVAPGGKVHLQATYAVLAPNAQQALPITETRVLTFGGQKVAELVSNVEHAPGTWMSSVPIDLKPDAQRGQYDLTVTLSGAGQTAQRTASFVVN